MNFGIMNTDEPISGHARYLDTPTGGVNAPGVVQLREELKEVTIVHPIIFQNHAFVHYLMQCLYPNGTVRAPLRGQDLNGYGYLSWTLRKLRKESTYIYALCD